MTRVEFKTREVREFAATAKSARELKCASGMTERSFHIALAALLVPAVPSLAFASQISDGDIVSITVSSAASEQVNLDRGLWRAACDCNTKLTIAATLTSTAVTNARSNTAGNLEAWVGTDCANVATDRSARCKKIGAVVYSQLSAQVSFDPIGVQDAVASDGNNSCNKTTTSSLWVLADETGTSTTYSAQKQVPF